MGWFLVSGEAPSPSHVAAKRTFLEMRERPSYAPRPAPDGALILQAKKPTYSFYRYLYSQVGADHAWTDRLRLSEDELFAQIHDPNVTIYVLYVDGVPAGYGELDMRQRPSVELAYFGLMKEFIGRGYGGYFLRWVIGRAWEDAPERLWLHTCTLDHPNALPNYQKHGFSVFDTKMIWQDTDRRD